jgi:hypothetical protein
MKIGAASRSNEPLQRGHSAGFHQRLCDLPIRGVPSNQQDAKVSPLFPGLNGAQQAGDIRSLAGFGRGRFYDAWNIPVVKDSVTEHRQRNEGQDGGELRFDGSTHDRNPDFKGN